MMDNNFIEDINFAYKAISDLKMTTPMDNKDELISLVDSRSKSEKIPPKTWKIAVTHKYPKLSALLYDGVMGIGVDIPEPISVRFKTDGYLKFIHSNVISSMMDILGKEMSILSKENPKWDEARQMQLELFILYIVSNYWFFEIIYKTSPEKGPLEFALDYMNNDLTLNEGFMCTPDDLYLEFFTKNIAKTICNDYGFDCVPVLDQDKRRDVYRPGEYQFIMTVFEKFETIDEQSLTWDQVFEVRKDAKVRHDLIKLRNWLDLEMVGTSQPQIEDKIALQMYDYNAGIKKHGIKTFSDTISFLIQPQSVLAQLIGGAGGFILNPIGLHSSLASLVGLSVVSIGGITVKILESRLSKDAVVNGKNSEIAAFFTLKEKINKINIPKKPDSDWFRKNNNFNH